MIRLWAKLYKNNRLYKDTTFIVRSSKMDYSLFFDYVAEMCHALDVPTPLITKPLLITDYSSVLMISSPL